MHLLLLNFTIININTPKISTIPLIDGNIDSEPEKLDVKIVDRDSYVSGDCIWIMLDTFGDKTTAYEFGVNAAGVQSDDRVSQSYFIHAGLGKDFIQAKKRL